MENNLQDNLKLYDPDNCLQNYNARFAIFNQVTTELSHILDLNELIQKSLVSILEPISLNGGGVLYLNEGDILMPVGLYPSHFKASFLPLKIDQNNTDSFSVQAAFSKSSIIVNNTHESEFLVKHPGFKDLEAHCFGIFPLLYQNDLIGILNVFLSGEVNYFDQNIADFFNNICSHLAVFIINAKMHQEIKRRLEKLNLLYNIINNISKHLDLKDLIEECFKVFKNLNFSACKIYTASSDRTELILYSHYSDVEFEPLVKIKIGDKFSGLAALNKEPVVINNSYGQEAIKIAGKKVGESPHSFASFPLLYMGELKGILNLAAPDINRFDSDVIDLCISISKQLAVVLNNSELQQKTEKKLQTLSQLYEIANRLSKFIDFDSLVIESFNLFKELGFYGSKLYLISEDGKELNLVSHSIPEDGFAPLPRIQVGEYFSGTCALTHKPFIINNSISSEALKIDPSLKYKNPHSFASFPIMHSGKCLGVLNIASAELNKFNNEIIDFCENIVNQLSIVLQNAKLYNEMLERNKELKQLNILSYNLTQNLGLDEACFSISKQIENLIAFDSFYIDLYNEETHLLSNVINIDTIEGEKVFFKGMKNRRISSSVIENIINEKKPILILRQPFENEFGGLESFGDKSKKSLSLMFAPLISRSEIIGIISIQSYKYRAFNERDLELLTNLANILGASIKNILLYEKISDSEIRNRTLIENLPDYVYSFSKDGYFLAVNPKICQLLNISESELIGKKALDAIPQDIRKHFLINFARVVKNNEPSIFNFTYRKESEIYYYSTILAPIITADGSVNNFFGITRDITSQKEAEAQNLRIQRQVSESKRQEFIVNMTRNIAHVFNNILVNVLSRSSFAKSLIDPSNVAYSHLEKIEISSKKFSDLVRQLLDFSQSGKFKIESTDLNKVIQFFYLSKKIQIRTNIELKTELANNLPRIEIDRDQIINILEKITCNSIEALKSGGSIIISTAAVTLHSEKKFFNQILIPGEYVLLKITDNGEGIYPNVLERFFEPFNTTKEYGRGLGLPSVYGSILNLNGFINITSKINAGTKIDIYFPILKSK